MQFGAFLEIQHWSEEEKKQLRAFFKDSWDTCPTKLQILYFKRIYKCERDWKKIKYYVSDLSKQGKTSFAFI